MPSLVLGTAGHIDHGKSALVKALTGTDPDRLPEEKERGVTIELGFARLTLPSGRMMGVVDVPGHEKFVRQMVAGATGIDVVMLVVAADDGVMPQTREHLAIIDLLGISEGVVALTKSDLADDDWLELVRGDVERLLEGTTLEGAPIVAVSVEDRGRSRRAAGHARRAGGRDQGQAGEPAPCGYPSTACSPSRERAPWSPAPCGPGSASRDDPVEVYPSGVKGRVRGVQVHSTQVEKAQAGQRVAMNLAGIERDEIHRGDVIATPGTLTVTDRFDARFTYLGAPGDDKPFVSGARVHVNHGTREVLGRVLLMDAETLLPGSRRLRRCGSSSRLHRATTTGSSCAATRPSTRSAVAWCSTRCRLAARALRRTSASCSTRCSRTTCRAPRSACSLRERCR